MVAHRSSREVRTLVVHTGGIGDFLLFCPCLKRLAEDGPVELAGAHRDRLNLAVVSGLALTAHHLDDFDFGSIFGVASARFAEFAGRFDHVVVWMDDADGRIRGAFADAGVRDVRVFAGLPPSGWSRHAGEYYAECLRFEGLPPLLLPIPADEAVHDVFIHPGSGGATKNWPLAYFAEVASALRERGRRIEWIRGPAEERLTFPQRSEVVEFPGLVTLARHLSGTKLYIGNDSGITHLSAACGCSTVAIFGPTDAGVWAPRGGHVAVIAREGWPGIDEVLKTIARFEAPD